MYAVSVALSQLLPDGLQQANQVVDFSVFVLHVHVDDTAVVGNAVKLGADLYTSFSELFPDVPGEKDIGTALVRNFMDESIFLLSISEGCDEASGAKKGEALASPLFAARDFCTAKSSGFILS